MEQHPVQHTDTPPVNGHAPLRARLLEIRNICGIQELRIEPGRFTIIQGRNGAGKTSSVEAIKSLIGGGTDATLVRNGAPYGETVLVLDDGHKIRKRIPPKGNATVEVRKPDGQKEDIPPQRWIDQAYDKYTLNPIKFRTAKPSERVDAVLSAISVNVTADQLAEICGSALPPDLRKKLQGFVEKGDAFGAVEELYDAIYDKRTEKNRDAKRLRATIATLTEQLPKAAPAGRPWSEVRAEAEQRLEESRREFDRQLADVSHVYSSAGEQAESDCRLAISEADRWRAEELRRIDAEHARRVNAANAVSREKNNAALNEYDQAVGRIGSEWNPKIEAATQALSDARAREQADNRASGTRNLIDAQTREAEGLESEAGSMTAALEALESLKSSLLARIPIPGVEVKDGELYQNGVPFDRLNTQAQWALAFEVAKLRMPRLGLVCIDGAQDLDSWQFEAFRERALESGLQCIVTRVTDGPLEIITEE